MPERNLHSKNEPSEGLNIQERCRFLPYDQH